MDAKLKEVVMNRNLLRTAVLVAAGVFISVSVSASVMFSYDPVGRLTTALYDSGLCVTYAYDANGNRTAQLNTNASGPLTTVWGTGTYGCFAWTP
jgi:YD repeat-containing protein